MKAMRWTLCMACVALALAPMSAFSSNKKLKMRIAVAPIDWTDRSWFDDWQIPIGFRNAIDEKLQQKLLATGRFVILERGAMDELLQEKAIKEANTGQSQKGKIVPAQALVRGKLTDFSLATKGSGGGVSIGRLGRVGGSVSEAKCAINVRIFNVDTSELLASEEASGTASSSSFNVGARLGSTFTDFATFEKSPLGEATTKAIDQAVEKILKKLEGQPWSARVADYDKEAKEIAINAGSEVGVAEGDTFDVYRVTRVIRDPETNEILGTRKSKVGTVRVTSVEKKLAFAKIVEGAEFQAGDIITERS